MSLKRSVVNVDNIRVSCPKRIRGGGDDDFDFGEELYDEDFEEVEIPGHVESLSLAIAPIDDSVYQDISDEMKSRWRRPPVPSYTNKQDLNLQWLDIDVIGGEPLKNNPNHNKKNIVGSTSGQVPILRLFGVNETGNSVAVFIHGFTPYGYFALPANYEFDDSAENLAKVRNIINERLQGATRGGHGGTIFCHGVTYIRDHGSIMGYDTPHTKFFKVLVALPTMIPTLKRIMEDGITLPGVRPTDGTDYEGVAVFQPFECNVPFALRFMIDRDVSGAGWLTLPKETYQLRTDEDTKHTHCQVSQVE
jgi:DNA polymerase delta subunit 1